MIQYYKHNQIDPEKWNRCLNESTFGNIYCTFWYLGIIHPGWDALVLEENGEYKLIIPLLYYKRSFFRIHRTPILAQRLGIFGGKQDIHDHIDTFFKYIKRHFSAFHYPLDVVKKPACKKLVYKEMPNHYLELTKSYEDLYKSYRRDRKARLKQARHNALRVEFTDDHDGLLHLFKENVTHKIPGGVSQQTLLKIQRLVLESLKRKTGFVTTVLNDQDLPVSAAFFVRYKNRLTYLFAATNEEGKNKQANTLLLDTVIARYAGSSTVLDFEGATVDGIADFFKSFGAKSEVYYLLSYESSIFSSIKRVRNMPFYLPGK